MESQLNSKLPCPWKFALPARQYLVQIPETSSCCCSTWKKSCWVGLRSEIERSEKDNCFELRQNEKWILYEVKVVKKLCWRIRSTNQNCSKIHVRKHVDLINFRLDKRLFTSEWHKSIISSRRNSLPVRVNFSKINIQSLFNSSRNENRMRRFESFLISCIWWQKKIVFQKRVANGSFRCW